MPKVAALNVLGLFTMTKAMRIKFEGGRARASQEWARKKAPQLSALDELENTKLAYFKRGRPLLAT